MEKQHYMSDSQIFALVFSLEESASVTECQRQSASFGQSELNKF